MDNDRQQAFPFLACVAGGFVEEGAEVTPCWTFPTPPPPPGYGAAPRAISLPEAWLPLR